MIRNRVVAATFTCALSASFILSPVSALAVGSEELQAQIADAQAQLEPMYAQAEELSEKVNYTQYELDVTKGEIETKQAELADAQDVLAERVSSTYKTGGVSLMSILFESSSFDDLISRVSYASKVAASDAQNIQTVKDLQAELDAKEAEQEQLLDQQQSEKAELDAKVSEAENYISSLSEELQNAIAEEEAAARAAAAEAAAQAAAEAEAAQAEQNNNTENTDNNSNNSSNTGGATYSGSLSSGARSTIVSVAYSKAGNASYVWGAGGPDSFDCSGFVSWCYAQAGYSVPHSSGAIAGTLTQTSNPQPGDICWKPGHVGIYVGGGMMVDAANSTDGVGPRSCAADGIVAYYTL